MRNTWRMATAISPPFPPLPPPPEAAINRNLWRCRNHHDLDIVIVVSAILAHGWRRKLVTLLEEQPSSRLELSREQIHVPLISRASEFLLSWNIRANFKQGLWNHPNFDLGVSVVKYNVGRCATL